MACSCVFHVGAISSLSQQEKGAEVAGSGLIHFSVFHLIPGVFLSLCYQAQHSKTEWFRAARVCHFSQLSGPSEWDGLSHSPGVGR